MIAIEGPKLIDTKRSVATRQACTEFYSRHEREFQLDKSRIALFILLFFKKKKELHAVFFQHTAFVVHKF